MPIVISFSRQLFPGVRFLRFAVSREDLEMVEAVIHSRVPPDHLLLTRHLEKLDPVPATVVAGDHRVTVGQPLGTTGIIEEIAESTIFYFSAIFMFFTFNSWSR